MKRLASNLMKKFIYALLFICIGVPLIYFLIALLLSAITVNTNQVSNTQNKTNTIYLSSNGVHLDIVLPANSITPDLRQGLIGEASYYAFGWGDENFYLNTPTWADLTFKNGFSALLLNSSSLMHVTRFTEAQPDWVAVSVSPEQLQHINQHVLASFQTDSMGTKAHLPNAGYTPTDDFYKAHGSYTLAYTCNTWVNDIFKKSGLTASYWTPFDKGLLKKYKPSQSDTP